MKKVRSFIKRNENKLFCYGLFLVLLFNYNNDTFNCVEIICIGLAYIMFDKINLRLEKIERFIESEKEE
jgi:hypothetical protein